MISGSSGGSKRSKRAGCEAAPTTTYHPRFGCVLKFRRPTAPHMWELKGWMSENLPQIGALLVIEVDDDVVRPLNKGVKLFERLLRDESGATAVEYSLILGGIA